LIAVSFFQQLPHVVGCLALLEEGLDPSQADTAVESLIVEERYPFSAVKDANVLVFPSLESANIAYKLLARLGKAKAIGPILLGMGAPVHVLQTGDDVNAIVQIAAVAVMDAMGRDNK
jgi:malate dehydrogenase (oxaloacetate-decarboxylating)(NADP+)